jgi:hypothetical protein
LLVIKPLQAWLQLPFTQDCSEFTAILNCSTHKSPHTPHWREFTFCARPNRSKEAERGKSSENLCTAIFLESKSLADPGLPEFSGPRHADDTGINILGLTGQSDESRGAFDPPGLSPRQQRGVILFQVRFG